MQASNHLVLNILLLTVCRNIISNFFIILDPRPVLRSLNSILHRHCFTIVHGLFLTLLLYYCQTIICSELFPRPLKYRSELVNISRPTTPSYDRWTIFSIDLALRSFNDCSNSFASVEWSLLGHISFCSRWSVVSNVYIILDPRPRPTIVEQHFLSSLFYVRSTIGFISSIFLSLNDHLYRTVSRCYDCWTIFLNDPFFSHRMIIFDEPFSRSLNNHSNDRVLRFLMNLYEGPIFASNSRLRSFSTVSYTHLTLPTKA